MEPAPSLGTPPPPSPRVAPCALPCTASRILRDDAPLADPRGVLKRDRSMESSEARTECPVDGDGAEGCRPPSCCCNCWDCESGGACILPGVHAGWGHSVSVRAGQRAACQAPATAGKKTRPVSHTPRWCQRRGRPIARAHRLRCLAPAHGHDQVWFRSAVRARETTRTRGPQQHARVCMLLCRYLRPAACTPDGSSGDSAARLPSQGSGRSRAGLSDSGSLEKLT